MALKLIYCCHAIYTHAVVEEKLPQQVYNILEKSYDTSTLSFVVFLEVCKFDKVTPIGFNIKKTPCIGKSITKF